LTAEAHQRISSLASLIAVHRAFHWLHLHQPQVRRWQLEILRIPAPPFGEQARAAWFLERFHQLGLTNPHLDDAGNALAELPAASRPPEPGALSREPSRYSENGPEHSENGPELEPSATRSPQPLILISAHLDTVFPPGASGEPAELETRILAPGACDNAAGLSALLALAAALRHAGLAAAVPILFAANVGEEGEGDLRGMRHLFRESQYGPRIAAAIALEGSGSSAVVTRALASRRFRVTVTGPGGHSWTDAGAPNPILILAQALLSLQSVDLESHDLPEPEASPVAAASASPGPAADAKPAARTTLNVGHIHGGTSVNSIPESASALLDLRSTDTRQLESAELALRAVLAEAAAAALTHPTSAGAANPIQLSVETIGNRPGGALPANSPLLTTLRAVDRHLNLRTEPGLGSTDANIPLSLGVAAIAIGAGGLGGGIHTLQEWYDPTGRNAALRRILLTLLDTAQLAAKSSDLP
jgi:tripeptide aminopeptidase